MTYVSKELTKEMFTVSKHKTNTVYNIKTTKTLCAKDYIAVKL